VIVLVQTFFWLAVATIVYTFLGYPVLVALFAGYFRRPVKQAQITPRVTLVVPAYNEASVIGEKIENSLALDYPRDSMDIAVVTDGSTDETPEIVRGLANDWVSLFHQPERKGKAAAVNRVTPQLDSEIILFSDANTMLQPETLRLMVRNFADPQVGAVAGEKKVRGEGEGLYWRYESFLKKCDSALSSVMGAAGELFAVRRDLFEPPEEDSIIEDFIMSMRLVERGWRVVYEPYAVAVEEAPSSLAAEWQRRVRIAAGGFQSMQRMPGLLNPLRGRVFWQYLSHRVLRWAATPFLLVVVYFLNLLLLDMPLYRLLWVGQTSFYAVAFLGYRLSRVGHKPRIPFTVFYFCFTNAAALAGFWRFVTRSQPVTWQKVR